MCAAAQFNSGGINRGCLEDCKKELEKNAEDPDIAKFTCCDEDLCNGSGNLSNNNPLIFAVVYTVLKLFF